MSTDFGWINNPAAVEKIVSELPIPLLKQSSLVLDDKKEMLLYNYVRKVKGSDAQSGPQGIGDCVGWGSGVAVDYLQAVQTVLYGQEAEFEDTCTEANYALSRCEVGGQWNSYSDGSVGAWVAKSVSIHGTLSRKGIGAYSAQRAKEWGAKGLPDNLEPTAKKHLVKTVSLVLTFEEAVAAIQNGYPVVVCSNRGFTTTRDAKGFCSPDGVWNHCMVFVANRWDRPGLLCSQSWGPANPNGPRDKDQPTNTFWVDAKVATYMLSQGDSFAYSQHESFRPLTWAH